MARSRLFLRILYRSVYFLLYVALLALVLITPGDAIERSIRNGQPYNAIIVAAAYTATVLVILFVYAVRLFLNKSVLASIPKGWVPVEKQDLKKKKHVYELIAAQLSKSAAIAWRARPRVLERGEDGAILLQQKQEAGLSWAQEMDLGRHDSRTSSSSRHDGGGVTTMPVWGEIEHHGWASPNSPDLPDLEYATVLAEMPNLIEAKALTLAPADHTLSSDVAVLDSESVGLLQRPVHMGLREYMDHLVQLGVLEPEDTVTQFLTLYEYARFSTRPLSNAQFRELMHLFAEVLRHMTILDLALAADGASINGSLHDLSPKERRDAESVSLDASSLSSSHREDPSTPGSASTPAGSVRRGSVYRQARTSSANTWANYLTAPNTPGSSARRMMMMQPGEMSSRRSSGINSFAQTRRPYPISRSSSASLRSRLTDKSWSVSETGSGSVIRLSTREDDGDLPYVLNSRSSGSKDCEGR